MGTSGWSDSIFATPSGAATMHTNHDRRRVRVRLDVGDRGAARSSRREHRIEHEGSTAFHPRELRVVVARLERLFVALQAQVADDRVGIEVRDRIEESEPGPEHGDGHERFGDPHGLRLLHRRLDRDALGEEVARGLDHEQPSQPPRERPELGRVRPSLPEAGKEVVGERVVEHR